MSRKPIHLTIDMGVRQRLRYLFSGSRLNILLQPTTLGSVRVVDVIIGKQSNRPEVPRAEKPY